MNVIQNSPGGASPIHKITRTLAPAEQRLLRSACEVLEGAGGGQEPAPLTSYGPVKSCLSNILIVFPIFYSRHIGNLSFPVYLQSHFIFVFSPPDNVSFKYVSSLTMVSPLTSTLAFRVI